jgi:hypothetical protein
MKNTWIGLIAIIASDNLSDTITALDRVFIEFFVDTTGQIIHVKKLRGIGEPYDTEAIQLIQEHPHNCWAPATQSGRKLKTRFVISISFVDKPPIEKKEEKGIETSN